MQLVTTNKVNMQEIITFKLTEEELSNTIDQVINKFQKNYTLNGFRPGKAPINNLLLHYNTDIVNEIVQYIIDMLNKEYDQYLNQNKISKAVFNKIEMQNELEFKVYFEHLPEFNYEEILKLKVVKPVIKIENWQIQSLLDECIQGSKKYVSQDNPKVVVETGDIVTLELSATVEGQVIVKECDIELKESTANNNTEQNTKFNIIENNTDESCNNLSAITDLLLNQPLNTILTINEIEKINHIFKESDKSLNGKFKLKIKAIHRPHTLPLGDELAKFYKLENLASLQTCIQERINAENKWLEQAYAQQMLLNLIEERFIFDVPHKLLAEEKKQLKKDNHKYSEEQINQIALARVRLGIIIAEVAQKCNISITKEDFQQMFSQLSSQQQKEFINRMNKDKDYQENISMMLLKEKTLFWILSQVEVENKNLSVAEVKDYLYK